jgi:sigma-B regulation protein RsbU (phosphoserine phosphatase)
MKLKKRILIQTLSASLAFTLLLSLMFFITVGRIRSMVRSNSEDLGDKAADISAYALEDQVTDKIARIAADVALILDEKLLKIENHTRMTADIAGSIYTHREAWRPRPLRYVRPGEVPPSGPYLHTAPGVEYSRIRNEAELAGNIADILRQISVVDRGITTSTIGGESGYIIAMDTVPWPSADFDHRIHSWYRGAKEAGDMYWTDVYLDLRGRGPVISCAMPFYDASGGRVFKGVARSTVQLTDFSTIIASAKVGRTGYLFLVNRSGIKLFSSGSVDIRLDDTGGILGENYLKSADPRLRGLGLSMTLGASGMTELEMNGVPVYVAYAPIHTLGWSLGVAIPVQEIGAPAWLIKEQIQTLTNDAKTGMDQYMLLLSCGIGILLFLILLAVAQLSIRFTESVTGPILALNGGVREVSGGNLSREVSVKTGDELEELAVSFNAMTGRLREHIEKIAQATAEKQRIATELDVATQIQTSLLPNEFPPFPNRAREFDLFATVHPAREVGGDFYDFFFIDDDHFAIVVADVSGKGIPAALFMAITKTLIKNHIRTGEAPDLALENINRQLCDNNIVNMFVTLWLGILEISSGRLEYINAGHNPPLVKNGGGDFDFLTSPPDLVLAGMDDTVYHRRETALAGGDTLFLYTDGITEAADRGGDFYGKTRLRRFLNAHGDLPPGELLPLLRADIDHYAAGAEQSDDITMLALRITGEKPGFRSITLRAGVDRLGELVAFIGGELERAACPGKIRGQIELAAEELFVNIARYSGSAEVLTRCGTVRGPAGTTLTLSFADRGEPFNPLELVEPDLSAPLAEREVGGLGILIVKRTMDTIRYSYEEGMNRLEITKTW